MESHAHQYAIYALASLTGFICGAYFQEEMSIRNLLCLIQRDPMIFQQRLKLYPLMSTFKTNHENRLWKRQPRLTDKLRDCLMSPLYEMLSFLFMVKEGPMQSSNMLDMVKYGLPSKDNIIMYQDYIVSQDVHSKSIFWICEHLKSQYRKLTTSSSGDDLHLRYNDVYVLSSYSAQICKAFKSKIWYELELYVSEMTEKYGSVYAYTGPIYLPACQNGEDWALEYQIVNWIPVPVPSHYFKVLIMETESHSVPYMEGYIIPNRIKTTRKKLNKYLSNIDEIERYTGLSFFKGLRRNVLFENENYNLNNLSPLTSFEELSETLVQIDNLQSDNNNI